jgi:molybdate ABC transporter, permease protein
MRGADLDILFFTLRVATASTAVIFPIALALAVVSHSLRGRTRALLDSICSLPLVLPPTAVGFLLLEFLSRRGGFASIWRLVDIDVLFTPLSVGIAAAVMSFPLMFRAFRSTFDSADFRYFDLARTLGDSAPRAFFRIVIPLSWHGILSGVLLAYCRALGEFGATIIIAGNIPGRTQTLALAIYQDVQSGREQNAYILVLYIVLLAFAGIAASEWLMQRHKAKLAR